HTNSAAGAIPRLLDMKVEPFLIVSTVDVIIAQRLVRKLYQNKEKYFLNKAALATLSKSVNLDRVLQALKDEKILPAGAVWEKVPFYKPVFSVECKDGYSSRIGIHETLKVTLPIKELIIRGATTNDIEAQARKEGMLTMLEDGIFKCVQGVTTIEEVFRVVSE
ncbi:MAG: hypothetical protein Q8Q92_01390, partial [bacterium]|nr:hypothetical protein [bacterium]